MALVPSARISTIGTSSSMPRHYPGTLSQGSSQRLQHNVGVSTSESMDFMALYKLVFNFNFTLHRSRLCDLKPKTLGGEREGERVSMIPCCRLSCIM